MHYVGVDYHKRTSYVTVIDERGQVVKQADLANSKAALEAFLDGDDDALAVLEAGPTWTVMYDWLEQLLGTAAAGERRRVTLAHPGKVRVIAEAKVKTDRIDSLKLAQLLRADLIPEAYVPGQVTREQRRRLRQRMFWVRVSTMVKNRIHTLVARYPEHSAYASRWSDLFGKAGLAWLAQLEVAAQDAELLAGELRLFEALQLQIKASNCWVRKLAKQDERARLLATLPGIGDFFAVLLAVEIDDVERFREPKKLCSYAGLVPSTRGSGGHIYQGHITKQGNKWLRWACIEAVVPATRKDPQLWQLYQRLKAAKPKKPNIAKVAVARRLLTMAYRVLSQGRPYQPTPARVQRERSKSPAALALP